MEYEARQEMLAKADEVSRVGQDGEGIRMAQGCFLNQLPGVVFAAITLFWLCASFAGVVWRLDITALMVRAHQLLNLAMAPPHSVTILSRVASAGAFAKRAYRFVARRSSA